MRDLLTQGLQSAQEYGAEYAEIRKVSRRSEEIVVKNGAPEAVKENVDSGIGIRVLADGAWGFAASAATDDAAVRRMAVRAVRLARAGAALVKDPVRLAPAPVVNGTYQTPVRRDPFEVPLAQKLDLLQQITAVPGAPELKQVRAELQLFRETAEYANTDGSRFQQQITHSGAGITATAVKAGLVGIRSYPSGQGGNHRAAGFEFIEALDLPGHGREIREEAMQLLTAPACPNIISDVIIDSSQMALQVHESCGHPLEMDRILGTELSLAGGSFVMPSDIGTLRYGSPEVTITADATITGGLGSFGTDDEGAPAQRTVLVERGILKNVLTSRQTAVRLNQPSNGTMRADGWRNPPLVRMTNINLEPGDWSLAELIRSLKNGILFTTNTSWSIDDLRLNFQFATEIGYLIRNGSIVGIVKNPVYSGRTPTFWNSCDGVGHRPDWQLWGIVNCGKGDPLQVMRVGHGTPPARFRQVRIGV